MEKRPEQERIRIERIKYIEEKGISPFGQRFDRTANSKTIIEDFDSYTKEELENQ